MIAYSYLRQYVDAAQVVIMDTVIPGVDPWPEVLRNPYIWHFALHAIPALPETLVQGRQAEYFDFFFDVLSADPSKITPQARAEYVAAYRPSRADRGVRLLPGVCPGRQDNPRPVRPPWIPRCSTCARTRRRQHHELRRRVPRCRGQACTTALVPNAGHFTQEAPAAIWRLIKDVGGVSARANDPGHASPARLCSPQSLPGLTRNHPLPLRTPDAGVERRNGGCR